MDILNTKSFTEIPRKEDIKKIIHLPDLMFARYCENIYGINKGIYNTIENFLFTNGFTFVEQRRESILHFLNYLHMNNRIGRNGRLKFGNRGLSNKLADFFEAEKNSNIRELSS